MKGMMKEATLLVKIVSLAYLVLVLLGVYFALTNYQLLLVGNKVDREALAVGDSLLAATCIAETTSEGFGIKGLLSEEKLIDNTLAYQNSINAVPCFNYPKNIYVEINKDDNLLHTIGDVNILGLDNVYNSTFPASMKTTEGTVIPVRFTVFIA